MLSTVHLSQVKQMTKVETKQILKDAGLESEEYFTACDHELVVNFATVSSLDATADKLERLGIPKRTMRIALIVETDDPA